VIPEWLTGSATLKVFGVLSHRVGKYITMQMDARYGQMVRDRDAQVMVGAVKVCGQEVDERDDDSTVFVSHEQHASGLVCFRSLLAALFSLTFPESFGLILGGNWSR